MAEKREKEIDREVLDVLDDLFRHVFENIVKRPPQTQLFLKKIDRLVQEKLELRKKRGKKGVLFPLKIRKELEKASLLTRQSTPTIQEENKQRDRRRATATELARVGKIEYNDRFRRDSNDIVIKEGQRLLWTPPKRRIENEQTERQ